MLAALSRGFVDNCCDVTFITDVRSNKVTATAGALCQAADARDALAYTYALHCQVTEIANNPSAEVAWYFTETREQYRLTGAKSHPRAVRQAVERLRLLHACEHERLPLCPRDASSGKRR